MCGAAQNVSLVQIVGDVKSVTEILALEDVMTEDNRR